MKVRLTPKAPQKFLLHGNHKKGHAEVKENKEQGQSSSGGCPPCLAAGFAMHLCRIDTWIWAKEYSFDFIEQSLLEERGC